MTFAEESLHHRRLRAPRENGTALVEPPLDSIGEALAANLALRRQTSCEVHGLPLTQLSQQARRELLDAAWRYTAQYRDVPRPDESSTGTVPLLMAGHQPQLFHPGVWFKNYALSWLAQRHSAVAVNLVIDGDTIKNAAIRVPGGTVQDPTLEQVPFDAATAEIPFEERALVDRSLLASFGRRAAAQLAPLVGQPLLRDFWPLVVERARHTGNLGECLAQARHLYEARAGLTTLELPQSHVCRLPAFAWFAAHLLADLPRLRQVYNEGVDEYRRVNRVRNPSHPVPDLARAAPSRSEGPGSAADDWLEAPFWIWNANDPRRRRLFVRRRPGELLLTDRAGVEASLPLGRGDDLAPAAEALGGLARRGIKLRTRALATTLWARLVLCDLFLHGIGGAKYDQLTDVLISRFFGAQPPRFVVLSATLQLPVARERATPGDLRAAGHRLRELEYHPEKFLVSTNGPAAEAAAAKRMLLADLPAKVQARAWCQKMRSLNSLMAADVAHEREASLARREALAHRLRAERILAWREYAFCLYPEQTLRSFLLAFFPDTP